MFGSFQIGVIIAVLACAGAASADDVVFRSDVSLVRVDAQVLDANHRAITGLGPQDFVLLEDGKPQQIRNFGREDMPVDVVLLLDVSRSMRPHIERVARAAHEALRELADHDRVAIMVFDRSTRIRLRYRNSRDDVEREFERLLHQEDFEGGTDITRGMLDAADYIQREGRRDARRAIVIVTDDQTERNRDEAAVSRALTRADAVLCALIAPDAMQYGHYPGGGRRGGGGGWGGGPSIGGPLGGIILGRRGPYGGRGSRGGTYGGPHTQSAGTAEIARDSGGDSLRLEDASSLETTLARIRQRYALHFHLPQGVQPGQERNVEVRLASAARQRYPEAEVRYRRVYLAPDGSGASAGPTVVSRAPAPADTGSTKGDPAPRLRRRPAVNEPGSSGPTVTGDSGGWPQTEPAASAPQPQQQPQTDSSTSGGWPRAK